MNDKMLDIIGLADEKYLQEAEIKNTKAIKHRRRRFSAGMVAAAVIGLSTVTVGAAAVYNSMFNKDEVNRFYNNSQTAEQLESRGYADGRTVENGHLCITVQSFISDDYRGQMLISAQAADEIGRRYMDGKGGKFGARVIYTDNGEEAGAVPQITGTEPYISGSPISYEFELLYRSAEAISIDSSRPIAVKAVNAKDCEDDVNDIDSSVFEGLVFDGLTAKQAKSIRLYSSKGEELYVSEITVMAMHNGADTGIGEPGGLTIRYRDGTERTEDGLRLHTSTYQFDEDHYGVYYSFRELLDVDSIESIVFDGVEYSRKQ